jgi:hypothetical protein
VDDLTACGGQIEPPHAMPVRIGPVPFAHTLDCVEYQDRIEGAHVRPVCTASVQPTRRNVAAVIQDRVVEIQENRLWKWDHNN